MRLLAISSSFAASFFFASSIAHAWANEGRYTTQDGITLRYLIAAPTDPTFPLPGSIGSSSYSPKRPVLIFQEGDVSEPAPNQAFEPAQRRAQLEALSRQTGFLIVTSELRRQTLASQPIAFCHLDFFHRIGDLNGLIDTIKALPFVDSQKLNLIGHSAGAEAVSLVARGRGDIKAIVTFAGSLISCGELDKTCQLTLEQTAQIGCDKDKTIPSGRDGVWWRQLFYESQMFATITSLRTPYLAMVGENEETEEGHIGAVSEFKKYAPIVREKNRLVETQLIPAVGHNDILGSPIAWERAFTFIAHQCDR
jgi:hypothetical protein